MAFNWNSMVIYLFSLLLLFTIFWMWFLVIIFLCLLFFPKNLKNPNKLQIFSFLSHFCIIYVLDFITADSSSKFLCLVLNLIHKKSRNRGCRKGPPSLSVTTSNIVVPPLQTLNLHAKNVSPNWTTRFAKPLSQNLHILLVQSAYSPCFYEGDQRLLDTFQVRHGRRHCAGKCGCRFKSRYGCTDCVGSIFVDFFSAWPGVFLLQFSLNPLGAWENHFGESNLSVWFWPKQHSRRGQPIAQNQKPNHLLFLQVWQLGQPIWCCMLLFTWKRVNMFIVTAMLCMGNTSTSPCSPCLP